MPPQLWVDLVDIARDEAKHFSWLEARLGELGSMYGALLAHRALWEQGHSTRGSLAARLAIVPLVQEAKALDAGPRLAAKLQGAGDAPSRDLVAQICAEEVGHVYKGLQWFVALAEREGADPVAAFHAAVHAHCPSPLQGPFNEAARAMAHMWPEWFDPVSNAAFTKATWAAHAPLHTLTTSRPEAGGTPR